MGWCVAPESVRLDCAVSTASAVPLAAGTRVASRSRIDDGGSMRSADPLRYILWCGVAATAARNRKEYGVPTAWLTHLLGNTVTLFLPDLLRIARARSPGEPQADSTVRA